MNKRKVVFYSLILAVSLLFPAFSSCGVNKVITYTPMNNANDGKYSSFSATGIPLFSFEYPVDYVITSYHPMPEFTGTSVMLRTLASIPPTTTMTDQIPLDFVFNNIYIDIVYLNEYAPPAEAAVDNIAVEYKRYEESGSVKDFKIIYKRQVVVGGVKGWEIEYSFINYPETFAGYDTSHPMPLIVRNVYFDYKDMSFNISLFSDAAIIDKTEKAYEHILQTFKLLE
jgi:hypothetical protein